MAKLEQLENLLKQGKINRREFITRVSALGIAAALSPVIIRDIAHAAGPNKGGRLRIGITGGSTSDSLDPSTITATMMQTINWQMRNNLTEIDHQGNVIPELAESWESSPDATKWVFNLRKDVEFHNGKTLDANDVLFTINHHGNKDSKSPAKALIAPVIKDMKADGKNKVVFNLKSANADFPYLLSVIHLSILPTGTTDFKVGTGGYQFVEFEPGVSSLTKRNPNYWKNGRAHFDEVEVTVISDVNARTNALMTGQIDVMNWCDLKTIHMLEKKQGVQVISSTGRRHYTFPMLMDQPPFDDNNARLAMKYAIDRDEMIKRVLKGYGVAGNDHPVPPFSRYFASELPQKQYDPDKAKYYIKKAGLENTTFKLHTAPNAVFPGAVDAALVYRQSAAKAGIKIDVVKEPDDGYWKRIWRKSSWCACYWSGRPTDDLTIALTYASDAKWNDTHFKNEKFDNLLNSARGELNETKRRDMYVEMQKILSDEGGQILWTWANWVDAASSKLNHTEVSGHRELDGHRLPERWWFA